LIVVDTTILALAVGAEHDLRQPARDLVAAIAARAVEATTTAEVIQEFAHVRARRRDRTDAVALARRYADLLAPLLIVEPEHLERGLMLFEKHSELGAFDAVLAATAIANDATAFVSADTDFRGISGLRFVAPGTEAFAQLLMGTREGGMTGP
jgi:predicted nucleic acid-binding protein